MTTTSAEALRRQADWEAAHDGDPVTIATLRAAAVPSRVMLAADTPVVEVHHHDLEAHAESFNQGYDAAVKQQLEDHPMAYAAALRTAADRIEADATSQHRPVTRWTVDDGETSHETEAEALDQAASWTDPALVGQPIDLDTFEVCVLCGPLELLINARDDYEDSLWPCAATRAAERDAKHAAMREVRRLADAPATD
jgi:hypothetical protein